MDLAVIVDIALGLGFIYLFFSLICSGVMEWIARFFALRAATLEAGIRALLKDPDQVAKLYGHPLITALRRESWFTTRLGRAARPAYIPARIFALTVLDNLAPSSGAPLQDVTALLGQLEEATPEQQQLKQALTALALRAGDDVAVFRTDLERWFDDVMERASGSYKRTTQTIIFVVALVAAVAFNVDSLLVVDALSRDAAIRAALAGAATEYVKQAPAANLPAVQQQIEGLRLPIGWDRIPPGRAPWLTPIGWLISALAFSQGAPFWFELLAKLVNVRQAGPVPATSQEEIQKQGRAAPVPGPGNAPIGS